jgi:hypothetical protein
MTESETFTPLKWPEIDNNELFNFYNEIKENKILKINWTNPGRIDSSYFSQPLEKDQSLLLQSGKVEKLDNTESAPSSNAQNSKTQQFDPFAEFNDDMENYQTPIFDMRLMHGNKPSRESLNGKKVATMDKILDDLKTRYEYETEFNQQAEAFVDAATTITAKTAESTTAATGISLDPQVSDKDQNITNLKHVDDGQEEDDQEDEMGPVSNDDGQKNSENTSKTDEEIETFKQPTPKNQPEPESALNRNSASTVEIRQHHEQQNQEQQQMQSHLQKQNEQLYQAEIGNRVFFKSEYEYEYLENHNSKSE